MIIIADSGSTKADWRIIKNKEIVSTIKTIGFNPFFHSEEFIINELRKNFNNQIQTEEVEKILTITDNQTTSLSLKELKPNSLNKLKKKRFLYSVDKNNFLPFDNAKTKYFTQTPIEVKSKEKINDVHNFLGI
jgi:predicted RNA-binding protein with RPS1 domain